MKRREFKQGPEMMLSARDLDESVATEHQKAVEELGEEEMAV